MTFARSGWLLSRKSGCAPERLVAELTLIEPRMVNREVPDARFTRKGDIMHVAFEISSVGYLTVNFKDP